MKPCPRVTQLVGEGRKAASSGGDKYLSLPQVGLGTACPCFRLLSPVGGARPLPSVGPLPSSQQRVLFVHQSLWGFPDGIPGLAGPWGESWYVHFPSLQLWVSPSRVADRKSKCCHLSGAWSDPDLPEPPECAAHGIYLAIRLLET